MRLFQPGARDNAPRLRRIVQSIGGLARRAWAALRDRRPALDPSRLALAEIDEADLSELGRSIRLEVIHGFRERRALRMHRTRGCADG